MTEARSLYVHIPWCVRKCPYCDFNSHGIAGELPEADYVDALLSDLETETATWPRASIESIFIGGGTPSVFSPSAIERLLAGIDSHVTLGTGIEITMEANPGTLASAHLPGFRSAGVNRLSLGIQSFDDVSLKALGRIHSSAEATEAYQRARDAGFDNINLDLMHGLPGQDRMGAARDLLSAIALAPEHISWYQLTIEPNTVFYSQPPRLPDEDTLWDIYESGMTLLEESGYARYEISAFAQSGRQSVHNLNYWRFGDYLGIGAGAHGKLTDADGVKRTAKSRTPSDYMANQRAKVTRVTELELPLEFLMNALRLHEGFTLTLFEDRTRLPRSILQRFLSTASDRGLINVTDEQVKPTDLGLQFLNDLLMMVEDRIA